MSKPAYHMRFDHEIEPRGVGGILVRCPLGIEGQAYQHIYEAATYLIHRLPSRPQWGLQLNVRPLRVNVSTKSGPKKLTPDQSQ